MKQLIENLREQYRMYGTNHVQHAADVIEMLTIHTSIAYDKAAEQAKMIEGLMQETEELADRVINCERQIKELTAERDAALAASRWETDLCHHE